MSFGSLIATLNLNIANFASQLRAAAASAARFGANLGARITAGMTAPAKAAGTAFKDVSRIVQGIIISQVFYKALGAIQSATSAVVQFNMELENTTLAFSSLMGSTDLAKELVNVLKEYSAITPFSFEDSEAAARRLLAYGVEYKNIMFVLQGVLAASAIQNNPQTMDSVSRALGQIYTKGRLMNEEMRQLAEAGIPAYEILREELQLTQEQMGAIADQGITASAAINALVTGINKRFGGMVELASQTMSGVINNIKDNAIMIGSALIDPMMNSMKGLLTTFGKQLLNLRKVVDTKGIGGLFEALVPKHLQGTIRELVAALVNLGKAFSTLMQTLQPVRDVLVDVALRIGNILIPVITAIMYILTFLNKVIFSNSQVLTQLTGILLVAASAWVIFRLHALATAAITVVVGIINNVAKAIQFLTTALTAHPIITILSLLGAAILFVALASSGAGQAFSDFVSELMGVQQVKPSDIFQPEDLDYASDIDKFNESLDGTNDLIKDMGDKSKKAAKDVKGLLSFDEVFKLPEKSAVDDYGAIADTLGDILGDLGALKDIKIPEISIDEGSLPTSDGFDFDFGGLLDGLEDLLSRIWDAIKKYWQDLYDGLKQLLTDAWEALKTLLTDLWDALKTIFMDLWDALKTLFMDLWDALKTIFMDLWDAIKTLFMDLWDAIKTLFMDLWDALKQIFKDAWDALKQIFMDVWDGLKQIFMDLWDALKQILMDAWDGIKQIFMDTWDGLKQVFMDSWDGLKQMLMDSWDGLKQMLMDSWDGIKQVLMDSWDGLKQVFMDSWDAVKTVLMDSWDGLKTILGDSWDALKTILGDTWDALKTVFGDIWDGFKTIFQDLWDGFKETMTWLGTTAAAIVEWTIATAQAFTDWAIETSKAFVEWGIERVKDITTFVVDTGLKIGTWVVDTGLKLSSWAVDTGLKIGTWVADRIKDFANFVVDTGLKIATWATDTALKFSTWATDTALKIGTWATDTALKIGTWAVNTAKEVGTWVVNTAKDIGTWAVNTAKDIGTWAVNTAKDITNWAIAATKEVASFVIESGLKIGTWAKETGLEIGTWAVDSGLKIAEFASKAIVDILGFSTETSRTLETWSADGTHSIETFTTDTKTGIGGWVSETIETIGGWATNIFKTIGDTFASITKTVGDFFSGNSNRTMNFNANASVNGVSAGHAVGGVFNREHVASFAEDNKPEAIIPLDNDTAMRPFVEAVSNGIVQSLAPFMASLVGSGSNQSAENLRPLFVGTLIADERGLKELNTKMNLIQLQEDDRRGISD